LGGIIFDIIVNHNKDSILVDTYLGKDDNDVLLDWVTRSGYNLKYIYVTHGHGDHWFGVHVILQKFRRAQLLATKATAERMKKHSS
jgi:glyoxylase-like metal-dependent hydrolase (beta-lactamase superfamily II)